MHTSALLFFVNKRVQKISQSYKGDVLLEFSSVKWDLNEDDTLYCNALGTLLLQNFVLVNSYFNEFFVAQTTVVI